MKSSLTLSFIAHVAIFIVAWIGLPAPDPILDLDQAVVEVEMMTEEQLAATTIEEPPPEPEPEPTPEPPPEPEPEPTPPPPEPEPEPAPLPPEPEPIPEPEPAPEPEPIPEPEPEPEPVPEPEPEPVPDPEPEPEPEPEARVEPETPPAPRPRIKPTPPKRDNIASLLKTVEDLKEEEPKRKPEAPKEDPADTFRDALASLEPAEKKAQPAPRSIQADRALSLSELEAVKIQIAQCWNVPAGARDARNMVIPVRVRIGQDRIVRHAELADTSRLHDSFYVAVAESAIRAVVNPRCSPLKLPPDKYHVWNSIVFNFDPREMLR